MERTQARRKWSELHGLPVTIPTEGRRIGTIEDFYFEPGSQFVNSLLVHTQLGNDLALPAHSIRSISAQAVTVDNEEMLTRELPPLPLGTSLHEQKVVNDKGRELGHVSDVWLSTDPPSILHLAALEMSDAAGRRHRVIGIDAVESYEEGHVTIES